MALREPIEMPGRHAGPELGLDEGEDLGDDPAGDAHLLDLAAGLAGDHQPTRPTPDDESDGSPSSAAMTPPLTTSIGSRPSTVRRLPARR